MLYNYLKTALRNLLKQRFYTVINLLGLAGGIACCLLIGLWVWDEMSYDTFNTRAERIYRVRSELKFGDTFHNTVVTPSAFVPTAYEDFPEVNKIAAFRDAGTKLVKRTDQNRENRKEHNVIYGNPEVFEVFDIPVRMGDAVAGLKDPHTVAISESARDRYFPDENPIGKELTVDNGEAYKVVAVYEDIPTNAQFHYDFIYSLTTLEETHIVYWGSYNFVCYLLLHPGKEAADVEARFPEFIDKHIAANFGGSIEEMNASGFYVKFALQPLLDVHLGPGYLGELKAGGSWQYVYIFSAVALFILIIAGVNFVNLSTARSANRAREVGVRKTLGSSRSALIGQFLTESIVLVAIAFVLGLLIADIGLPFFNQLADKTLAMPWGKGVFVGLILLGILLVGALAGAYPALMLSAFRPIQVLKGKFAAGSRNSSLRSTLVVFQFATSMVLITATAVVYQQLQYIQEKNLGFDKARRLIIQDTYSLDKQLAPFVQELRGLSQVEHVTASSYLPVSESDRYTNGFNPPHDLGQTHVMQSWAIDENYIETLGLEVVAGRSFDAAFRSDSQAVILNEAAAKMMGIHENPVGQRIGQGTAPDENGESKPYLREVVGMVKDFHFESLQKDVDPVILTFGTYAPQNIVLQFNGDEVATVLPEIAQRWQAMNTGQPFAYSFMDERFDKMYETEQRTGKVFAFFAALAVVIACLGLFALATFMGEQRTKEISIRKVLGASSVQILSMLSRDFVRLLFIALIIAVPIGWYALSYWLEDYAYRVELNAGVFIVAGLVALAIALLTVSSQSLRVARTNPADALRDE